MPSPAADERRRRGLERDAVVNRKLDHDSRPAQRPLEILIVDGDRSSADRIRGLVAAACGEAANIRRAASADAARAVLENSAVDLCLADFLLGHADDFAFARGTDNGRPRAAFVYLADQPRRDWVYAAIRHGAQNLMRKDRLDSYEIAKALAFALVHKGRELELTAGALRDPLTGLGNRALFNEQVKILLEQARRNREQLAVLFMDVDGLKPVNDRLGHSVGDRLLQQIAQRVGGGLRKSDVVARMGGDEFAAVLPRVASAHTVSQLQAELTGAVESKPYLIDTHVIRIGLSCGSALFPDDGASMDELLDLADSRMYAAKAGRRDAPPRPPAPGMSWFTQKPPAG